MLERKAWNVPDSYPLADSMVVPMRAGEGVEWSLV